MWQAELVQQCARGIFGGVRTWEHARGSLSRQGQQYRNLQNREPPIGVSKSLLLPSEGTSRSAPPGVPTSRQGSSSGLAGFYLKRLMVAPGGNSESLSVSTWLKGSARLGSCEKK